MILKYKFFDLCQNHEYNLSKIEGDEEEKKDPEKIELIEKNVNHKEDMNKNFNEHTKTFKEIISINWDIYLGLILCFASTLFCFPVLSFQLGPFISPHIRSCMITLLFNIGDISSRIFAGKRIIKINNVIYPHILNVIKFSSIFLNIYLISSSSPYKIILVFVQGFLNGYLCLVYIQLSTIKFDSIYDKNRVGYLSSFSILTGLSIGSILSFFIN